jgi:hypothetical protein
LVDSAAACANVQILFEGRGDEARQQWIIEAGPPGLEVRFAPNLPVRDAVLTEKAGRHGNVGRPVIRADRATRQEAAVVVTIRPGRAWPWGRCPSEGIHRVMA